ncbi:YqhR family membrane protein [Sporolactobacillus vineae]|uniref:YqhR family membrane protein n=1 Tax=Sporolactobacillus vineae TaxID=444463 RepID=UPI000287C781|nr:YqhR family membrane protein [Sporolactobacillus vineae]
MKKNKPAAAKNKQPSFGKSVGRTTVIGLFAGFFWGSIALVCQLIHFSSVGPSLLFSPFIPRKINQRMLTQFIAIAVICLISVIVALLFQLILSRFKTIWTGIGYGILLWAAVFLGLQHWLPGLPVFFRLGWNTFWTTLCLFMLYGLFIGYSIAFDLNEKPAAANYSKE